MTEKMKHLPRVFFNEYFRRKPERLHERENSSLFLMEKTEECDNEYVPLSEFEEMEKRLEEAEEVLRFYLPIVSQYGCSPKFGDHDDPTWCEETCGDYGKRLRKYFAKKPATEGK